MPTSSILNVFAKSPIGPLQEHVNKVASCSRLLISFFEASHAQNWDEAKIIRKKISKKEREADDLKRKLRLILPKGLFMAIDRGDLLELMYRQDKMANIAKDISGRVLGRKLELPDEIYQDFICYVKRNIDAVIQAQKVINELDELLETGFKGREAKSVTKMINELDLIEDDSDFLQIKLRRSLLKVEKLYDPIDMMFIYQIIELIGNIADHAEVIGSQLELILARS